MNRWRLGLALFVVLVACVAPVRAQTAPELEVRIERDLSPRASINELGAPHRVTLIDGATGKPPAAEFDVYGQAASTEGKEQTAANVCEELSLGDPAIPPRVYYCPVYVDHGGSYVFTAVVYQPRANQKQAPVTVAKASAPFQLETNEVYTGDPNRKVIRGRFVEVAALTGHAFSAAVWFLCVLALAALVFPAFRRSLSADATYRLERHLDLIVKLTWAATGVVIASGTYLLVNQTAYKTPFSKSAIDGVFALPFGKPYFLALAAKLAIYAVMVLSSIPLVRGAQRNLRLTNEPAPAPGPWAGAATVPMGGVGTVVETPVQTAAPPAERPTSAPARVATFVVLVGLPAILVCVTLLKYFHELVEASRVFAGS